MVQTTETWRGFGMERETELWRAFVTGTAKACAKETWTVSGTATWRVIVMETLMVP